MPGTGKGLILYGQPSNACPSPHHHSHIMAEREKQDDLPHQSQDLELSLSASKSPALATSHADLNVDKLTAESCFFPESDAFSLWFLMLACPVWKMSLLLASLGSSVSTRFGVGPINNLQSCSCSEMLFKMLKRPSLGLLVWTGQACFFQSCSAVCD